jgi:capsular exopolysaccharide synthesis family protein
MVTSSQSSEGKSFLAMNMMRTLAGLGKNVVFVDADLRRSYITNRYGVRSYTPNAQGLAHYLAGMCEIGDALFSTDIIGAYMVPVGRTVTNSLPLLSTSRLKNLLDTLARTYDVVIVDAPPLGILIDAAEIAKSCDGALLTVSYNKVSRRELNDIKNQIIVANCRVLGVVINNVTFDTLSSKRYHYRSYYSHYTMESDQPEREKPYNKRHALSDRRIKTR